MAFGATQACTTTVSVLEALVFGAGEACISVGMWSVLGALLPFVVGVTILQFIARRALAKLVGRNPPKKVRKKSSPQDLSYDGGPIDSTGAWRR